MFVPPKKFPRCAANSAVSLTELIVVIAVLAVFAAIAVPSISGVFGGSQRSIAERNLNMLNAAVAAYNQCGSELTNAANDGATTDELAVIQILQTQDPSLAGSPFLPPNLVFPATSSSNSYRAQWTTNQIFRLRIAGTNGAGVNLLMQTSP